MNIHNEVTGVALHHRPEKWSHIQQEKRAIKNGQHDNRICVESHDL
jgi:hypothetical protein